MLSPSITLVVGSVSLVSPINDPRNWDGFGTVIEAAKKIELVTPKVVAAIVDGRLHIAVGFPSDYHNQIAYKAFNTSLGADWQRSASDFGGGDLQINFRTGTVSISGRSTTLDGRGVPSSAKTVVIQEVCKLLDEGSISAELLATSSI